jgi:hypothetical protein
MSNFSLSGCLTFSFQDKFCFDLQTNASRTMFFTDRHRRPGASVKTPPLRHSGVRPGRGRRGCQWHPSTSGCTSSAWVTQWPVGPGPNDPHFSFSFIKLMRHSPLLCLNERGTSHGLAGPWPLFCLAFVQAPMSAPFKFFKKFPDLLLCTFFSEWQCKFRLVNSLNWGFYHRYPLGIPSAKLFELGFFTIGTPLACYLPNAFLQY